MSKIFWCNQQTEATQQLREVIRFALPDAEHKAAMPPFNCREGSPPLPSYLLCYDVPCYGISMRETVMEQIITPEIMGIATELQLPVPQFEFDTFLQTKTDKIRLLLEAAKTRQDCNVAGSQNMKAQTLTLTLTPTLTITLTLTPTLTLTLTITLTLTLTLTLIGGAPPP